MSRNERRGGGSFCVLCEYEEDVVLVVMFEPQPSHEMPRAACLVPRPAAAFLTYLARPSLSAAELNGFFRWCRWCPLTYLAH